MSVCVDYYYVVLVVFPLIAMQYVSLCGLLLFCFGTVPSNWYVICQSVWIIIILFWYCSLKLISTMSVCVDYYYFVLVLFPLIGI